VSLDRPWALALLAVPVLLLWLRLRAARPREAEASSLLVWSKVSQNDTQAARPRPPVSAWIEALGAAALALGLAGPGTGGTPTPLPGSSPPPKAGGFNAGITVASGAPLPDGRWRLYLCVEAFGAPGPVEGTLSIGDVRETVTVAPGTPLDLVRDVPAGAAGARIEFKGDVLAEDDGVATSRLGGARVVLGAARQDDPLARALLAAGAELSRGGRRPLYLGLDGGDHGRNIDIAVPLPLQEAGPELRGATVVASEDPLVRDVHVDPTATLGRRSGEAEGERPLLLDKDGPLAMVSGVGNSLRLSLAFIPGGTWVERDPSFVVFAKNLVEYAAGGPARVEATGVLSSAKTREAAEGTAPADDPVPSGSPRVSWAFHLLMAGALLLAAAWLALR
jgi:hypothetical protein